MKIIGEVDRYVFVGAGSYLLFGPKIAAGALLVSVGIQIIKGIL
jgi:hypothetical protein